MHGPLRYETTKYRRGRRHELGGAVPGLEYPSFPSSRRPVSGLPPIPGPGGFHEELYNGRLPREYHPSLDAPAVQSDEYTTDPDWESHQVSPSHQDRVLRPFPESEPVEPPFDYDRAKIWTEFFLKVMEVQYRPLAEGEEVPTLADIWHEHFTQGVEPDPDLADAADGSGAVPPPSEETERSLPDLMDIAEALVQLRNVFPDDHPDIVNLRAAAHEILQHPELLPQPEDFHADWSESRLGHGNPYEPDLFDEPGQAAGQMGYAADDPLEEQGAAFEQQTLDDVLEGFEPDMMPATEVDAAMGLDAMVEPDEYPEPGTLEQITEQEALFGTGPMEPVEELPDEMEPDPLATNPYGLMPEDEITQAIDQAADEPDPYMRAQQLFDEQMQYMDNPFLMPGMGPGM